MHRLAAAAACRFDFIAVDTVQEGSDRFAAIRIRVTERRAIIFRVPAFAGRDARMTPHTGVQIDDKTEFLLCCFRQPGHEVTFCRTVAGPVPTGDFSALKTGWLPGGAFTFSTFTLRSNQAA